MRRAVISLNCRHRYKRFFATGSPVTQRKIRLPAGRLDIWCTETTLPPFVFPHSRHCRLPQQSSLHQPDSPGPRRIRRIGRCQCILKLRLRSVNKSCGLVKRGRTLHGSINPAATPADTVSDEQNQRSALSTAGPVQRNPSGRRGNPNVGMSKPMRWNFLASCAQANVVRHSDC